MEYGGTCPSCRRAQDQDRKDNQRHRESLQAQEDALREQEHLQWQNLQTQQRILSENAELAHLNEIKRRLLELSIEGVENPDMARKKIEIVIRSPEVIGNMQFFRELCESNLILALIYNQVAEEIRQKEEAERRQAEWKRIQEEKIRKEEWERDRPRREAEEKARKAAEEKALHEKRERDVLIVAITFVLIFFLILLESL
jgi:hypothetical protein